MRPKISLLGLMLVGPALLLLAAFFLAPALLTGVFAFTNMSTSTGISGGGYVITGNLVRTLTERGVARDLVGKLGQVSYIVDDAGLISARAEGLPAGLVGDIETRLKGRSYKDSRDVERDLKALPNRPANVRELKRAVAPFERSILNVRYDDRREMEKAIRTLAPDAPATDVDAVLKASFTGWVWTTDNFARLFGQAETWRLIGNTGFYVATTLAFNVGIGLVLALTTFYLPKRAGSVFSALWLLPRITPVVLYTVMWKWFTWDGGFVYVIVESLGLPAFNYMKGSVPSAWTIVILVNGFIGASFGMILFSGALRAIPVQQLWASEVDGASRWQQIRRIILPQLRWPILFVTSYQTLSLLSSYEQIWLTTNGGPGSTTSVWALEAFQVALVNYTGNLQYGLGAAMALVLVVVGLTLSIVYLRLFRFGDLVSRPRIEF
jgi:inositol-phosphate transport system permease protein